MMREASRKFRSRTLGITMRTQFLMLTAASICLVCPISAFAQTAADPKNTRADDVVMSPLTDMNLRKRDVPAVLEAALIKPYDIQGMSSCQGLSNAVAELDEALGDDIDVAYAKTGEVKAGNSVGAIAKSLISSFIPFRGLIREVSGANAKEREWQLALYAGAVRRAFLKGVGEQRGCAYPARSATAQVVAALDAERDAAATADKAEKNEKRDEKAAVASTGITFESVPVVQPVKRPR